MLDSYHRYREDIEIAAGLGLNAFRFSIEWARIEPEPGVYSRAELDHYRRVLAACHERGLTPIVTYWHFTSPRWFAGLGGWENPANADHFVRYCERAAKHLGDLTGAAATFNEPNLPALLKWVFSRLPQNPFQGAQGMMDAAAKAIGAERFSFFLTGNADAQRDAMLPAHQRALAAIKSGPGKYPVGVTLAIADEQAVGPDSMRDAKREQLYGAWLDAASKSDFVGVQTYTRARVGKTATCPRTPAPSSRRWVTSSTPKRSSRRFATRPAARRCLSMSPRTAWRPTTTRGAWSTSDVRWPALNGAWPTASTSAATSTGHCWTTTSGSSATGQGSGS
jgi:beta-glucosidase